MKIHLFFVLVMFQFIAQAGDLKRGLPPFSILKQEVLQTEKNASQLRLEFSNPEFKRMPVNYRQKVYMAINGVLQTIQLDSTFSFTYDLEPGKYVLKLWPGVGYNEIITDTLVINNRIKYTALVRFEEEMRQITVEKPVIYFQSDGIVPFSMHVAPKGDFTFTYPQYNEAWSGRVLPSGNIEINQQLYPYLFWESNQSYSFIPSQNGYDVKQENVLAFLEEKLTELGFTTAEKTDFITFWGPQMVKNERSFVQFEFNENCNRYAEITCTPAPNSINRVYISFCPWNDYLQPFVHPIKFEALHRTGFSILEWGGYSFEPILPNFVTSNNE